jgi:hypothetical protein
LRYAANALISIRVKFTKSQGRKEKRGEEG